MFNLLASLPDLLVKTARAAATSLAHNWLPLGLAIATAAILRAHMDAGKIRQALLRRAKVSILASVAFGAFTPFCACGTMAVAIGMLTTTLPWGPVMAFLTSSPLMSPDGFILIAGIVDLRFAAVMAIASVAIGLGSGYLTHMIEKKTSLLQNQTRFTESAQTCGCSDALPARAVRGHGCPVEPAAGARIYIPFWQRLKWREMADGLLTLGLRQVLPNFVLFVAIGFLVNHFVPTSMLMALFNGRNALAVPLAALIGLPLYVTGESAVPLIDSLLAAGAGGGSMLAFTITGQATSAWVIAGISTFMKKRVVGLYVLCILAGGILAGYLYDLLAAVGV